MAKYKIEKPQRRLLLGDSVTAEIRGLILQREVSPGDHLGLVELATAMRTSITPVRQALLQLAQDGWVTHEPHRGFRVAPLNRSDVIDTYRVWAMVEGEIAAHAAGRATSSDIESLRAADRRLVDLEDHSGESALELNDELHYAVHRASAAPKLVWFAQTARRSVPLQFNQAFTVVPGWAEFNRYGHTIIIDAIAGHDAEASRKLMSEHFVESGMLLVTHLDSLDLWSETADPVAED
ncbi:GntR family transcriptional regulator [Arthrobacter sp. NPDC056727]|uniref:GntR family transcriptional regulator n=1 Tax=Arthrobacter sp. NPDC056727 TaxID=3345927 RepID=UPI00367017BE